MLRFYFLTLLLLLDIILKTFNLYVYSDFILSESVAHESMQTTSRNDISLTDQRPNQLRKIHFRNWQSGMEAEYSIKGYKQAKTGLE